MGRRTVVTEDGARPGFLITTALDVDGKTVYQTTETWLDLDDEERALVEVLGLVVISECLYWPESMRPEPVPGFVFDHRALYGDPGAWRGKLPFGYPAASWKRKRLDALRDIEAALEGRTIVVHILRRGSRRCDAGGDADVDEENPFRSNCPSCRRLAWSDARRWRAGP